MALEVRPIEPEELERFGRVNLTAFGEKWDAWHRSWFEQRVIPANTMAAYDDGALVGSSMMFEVEVGIPGGRERAAGVTAVGVLPTHRRRGIMRSMLDRLLAEANRRGYSLAVLWASEGGIYSRFGFGPAAQGLRVELEHPKARLLPFPASGTMRLITHDDARRAFPAVHAELVDRCPAMIARDDAAWDFALSEEDPHVTREEGPMFFLVHEDEGRPDGYLVYRIRNKWSARGPENTLVILEMVGHSGLVTRDLWRYCTEVDLVRRIEASGRGLRPTDDPIPWLAADPQALLASRATTLWADVLDVRKFLERRRYRVDGQLSLEVRGDSPATTTTLRLSVDHGRGHCQPAEGPADLSFGRDDLGAISLGQECIPQLVLAGRARARSDAVARLANGIFGWSPAPWCFEDI